MDEIQLKIYRTKTMTFGKKRTAWLVYAIGAGLFFCGYLSMFEGGVLYSPSKETPEWFIWVGTISFGLCLLYFLWFVLSPKTHGLVLSPTGFRDERYFIGEISWNEVDWIGEMPPTAYSTKSLGLQLQIDETAMERVIKSRIRRRFMNTGSGNRVGNLAILHIGLDLSAVELRQLFKNYATANQPSIEIKF